MPESILKNGATTAIGSVPFEDAGEAVGFILNCGIDVPCWPQLPVRGFMEGMIPQCSEGLPFIKIDEKEKRAWCEIPEDRSEALTDFYQKIIDMDVEAFAISERAAAGLYRFIEAIRESGRKQPCLKGQVTGPVTMSLGLADQNKQALFHDVEMRDVVVNIIAAKARWQARLLGRHCEKPLIFLDEPVMAGFGTSAYLSLKAEHVKEMCNTCIAAVHEEGALAGVHCCSNTDWGMMMSADFDVLNFEAMDSACAISLYPDAARNFINRGGALAWGVVPTTSAIDDASEESVVARLREEFDRMEAKGFTRDELKRSCVLTPSCGAGGLNVDQCRKVFDLLTRLQARFHREF
ncbi:MAG: hypothetical protein DRP79_05775 [Planctomycetota bacterium]|nr:MAG: hypothetical protein DRP79_05775 [Planctomycetota bacterium]